MVDNPESPPAGSLQDAKPISRRRFMQAGAIAALSTIKGDHFSPSLRDVYLTSPDLKHIPVNADDQLKMQLEQAHNELNQAIDDACADITLLRNHYGIADLLKLRKGFTLDILSPAARKKARCTVALNADPADKIEMNGFADMVTASMKLEILHEKYNNHHPDKKIEDFSYEKLFQKLVYRYEERNPGQSGGLQAMEPLVQSILPSVMNYAISYSPPCYTAQEQQAVNARFMEMMETYRNHDGPVIEDYFGARHPGSIPVFILKETKTFTITDANRKRFGKHIPIPDRETLQRVHSRKDMSDTQTHILELLDRDRQACRQPSQDISATVSIAGPFGFGQTDIPVHIRLLNPHMHANRIQMESSQQAR